MADENTTSVCEQLGGEKQPISQIALWAEIYKLKPAEVTRLNSVLTDYDPTEQDVELREELRCILAARELASRAELTPEIVDRARLAFESGIVPFTRQEVD